METTLTALPFLEAKTVVGLVFELAEDFSAAVDVLAVDRAQRRILKLLEESLRRDIHFIDRHAEDYPQGLFQCLWNTCWWHDSPEATQHYEGIRNAHLASLAASSTSLCFLMEQWRQDREQRISSFT